MDAKTILRRILHGAEDRRSPRSCEEIAQICRDANWGDATFRHSPASRLIYATVGGVITKAFDEAEFMGMSVTDAAAKLRAEAIGRKFDVLPGKEGE